VPVSLLDVKQPEHGCYEIQLSTSDKPFFEGFYSHLKPGSFGKLNHEVEDTDVSFQ